jgi:hypothetical protein
MNPPATFGCGPASKWISMNLPNRDELLFRVVFAFPNDSRIGFAILGLVFMNTESGLPWGLFSTVEDALFDESGGSSV